MYIKIVPIKSEKMDFTACLAYIFKMSEAGEELDD